MVSPPVPDDRPPAPAGPTELPRAPVSPAVCPRCGAPYAPLQEYCLECGLRLPVAHGVVTSLGTAWRRRLRWYPGDWIWPALLFLLIAGLGAAVAILANQRDDGEPVLVATSPAGRVPETVGATGTGEATAPTATGATAPEPPAASPPATAPEESPPPPPAGPAEWPAGQSGYTVVLVSVPTSDGRAAAEAQAERAIDAGLSEVGVLNSSDYSSLHPGYFVVFSGIRASFDETQADLQAAHPGGYPRAYQRQISP